MQQFPASPSYTKRFRTLEQFLHRPFLPAHSSE
jgi:hypothetical protein